MKRCPVDNISQEIFIGMYVVKYVIGLSSLYLNDYLCTQGKKWQNVLYSAIKYSGEILNTHFMVKLYLKSLNVNSCNTKNINLTQSLYHFIDKVYNISFEQQFCHNIQRNITAANVSTLSF